nr:MAG TPA: hypothetical protein [Caudoviricetes sp.]
MAAIKKINNKKFNQLSNQSKFNHFLNIGTKFIVFVTAKTQFGTSFLLIFKDQIFAVFCVVLR